MSELKWNAPYMDRRTWILGELDHLNMSAEETLALLLIDYYNEQQQLITGVFSSQENIAASIQNLSLFDEFETEFARPLSSSEMQRLSSWMDVYDQQMILYALYEAGVYDKRSLDYIERILAEWKRKGLTPADYEEGRR